MRAAELLKISPEEYLIMDRASEEKSEFFDGEVYAMAGASLKHLRITSNLTKALGRALTNKPCRDYPSDLRVRLPTRRYVYPDATIVCGPPKTEDTHHDILLNPTVVFEVLSPSTESFDRGKKSFAYRSLETLREYFLISQDEPLVEHFVRQTDDSWNLRTYTAGQTIFLPSCETSLAVDDLYIDLPAEESKL